MSFNHNNDINFEKSHSTPVSAFNSLGASNNLPSSLTKSVQLALSSNNSTSQNIDKETLSSPVDSYNCITDTVLPKNDLLSSKISLPFVDNNLSITVGEPQFDKIEINLNCPETIIVDNVNISETTTIYLQNSASSSNKTKSAHFKTSGASKKHQTKSKLERVGGSSLIKSFKEKTMILETTPDAFQPKKTGYSAIEKEIENFALPIVMEMISKSRRNSPNHSRKPSVQLNSPNAPPNDLCDINKKVESFANNSSSNTASNVYPNYESSNIRQRRPGAVDSSINNINLQNDYDSQVKEKNVYNNINDFILYQKFLVKIGQSLGEYGCPLYRLEINLDRLSTHFGVNASFAAFPGFIVIFFSDSLNSNNETKVVKLETTFDLQKLELVDALLDDVIKGDLDVGMALTQLPLIKSLPPIYPWYIILFGYCIASMGVAPLAFNGGWRETWLSFFLGAFVYLFEQMGSALPEFRNLVEFTTAVVVGFITTALSKYVCFGSVVLSSIVVLLPGMILTTGFIELMARSMIMGSVKSLYALLVMLMLTFGVQVGQGLYIAGFSNFTELPHTLDISQCVPMSPYWWFLFFPVSMISICIMLNMPAKRWPLCILTSSIMFTTFLLFKNQLKLNQLSTVASAFALGLSSNICDKIFGTPPFIFLVPATMILVPGSVGVRTLSALFDGSSSAELISRMLTTCLSIVVGLFMATFVYPGLHDKKSGLLFADDAVILAESADELQKSFDTLTGWCKRWDMNVNNKKCGIMAINCSADTTFKIQNQLIPSVKEYKYLGIENDMPTKFKVIVIKAIILAVATYGGELFGMSATRCKPIQQVVDAATRTLAKCGKSAAMVRLRQELSLINLNIKTAVARTRAFGKWANLRTRISDLIKCPYKNRYNTCIYRRISICRTIASETIESILLICSRWQALRADILAQYINIYKAQVATKPPFLSASISIRLVGKLLGEELKLSNTRICKVPTVLCAKTTLVIVKSLKQSNFYANQLLTVLC
ncbi:hypothetical protein BB561_001187 [Smittium simulii]|uniref:Threonine/serine exporter-like N-terminal domain-containing protein n=1 Tax=Smittium simulii TaxID=133385 RepID=A0A2T9YVP0_9FUNG|nr:hypothetical protein BB561_001187 [Smittium simulii]